MLPAQSGFIVQAVFLASLLLFFASQASMVLVDRT